MAGRWYTWKEVFTSRNIIFILKKYIFFWILKLLCGMLWYCKGVDFMSILEELWYGNIKPCEDKDISDEEKKLVELMARH